VSADTCSSCGGPLSSSAHGANVCPRCAFGWALEEQTTESAVPTESQRIGPFRLTRVLGEGGMGIVWEAEQEQPVRRRVALKWIRPGMDSAQVLARFESERQALALMSSPHIAQVFEAGRSPDGRPWFAMEYVEGTWITDYCDAHRLATDARLELFEQVCHGVQHAHHKGVIHRDIKPSNVLVREENGRPIPKIIDFGLAKAMGAQLVDRSLVTRLGQHVGTPGYMSPEQAGPAGFDVDTRSDVYSLGVLLFDLLTGKLPFEAPDGDVDALRRRIREEDPPVPSARVAALPIEVAQAEALARGTDRVGLLRALRGDLDWIVVRALAKDRSRRYGTPDELAADVRRHRAHEPVLAGPPGLGYRARKFVRRHAWGATAATTILVLLAATAIGMTIQARRIAREARTAQSALRFLTETFRLSDPERVRGETITAREILDRAATGLERELSDNPEVEALMTLTIGHTYLNLGLFVRAEPLVRRALEIRRETLGARHPSTHEAMLELSEILFRRGVLDEAAALARKVLSEDDSFGARAHYLLGQILADSGKLEEAETELRAAVDQLGRAEGPESDAAIKALLALGEILSDRGRYDEAGSVYKRALDAQRRLVSGDHPNTAAALNGLGVNARRSGNYVEAEALLREALAMEERVLGAEHLETLAVRRTLGLLLVQMGRLDEAEPILRDTLEATRRQFGPGSDLTLSTLAEWAELEAKRKNYDEAERDYREALAGYRALYGEDHPQTVRILNNLGQALKGAGRLAEAEPILRACLAGATKVFGPQHPNTLTTLANVAELVDQLGRHGEALPLILQALAGLREAFHDGHALIGLTQLKQGACLTALRRYSEAETALLAAQTMLAAKSGPEHPNTRAAESKLVTLYESWGKPDLAAKWRR
jgi:tetratricopeptide (TPR) repeat protein/tRNA A-37 threonylcarbamoyl transferase component Bud32